ncbi:carnosine N-methyltransferase [Trifolium repens]|nr:carnosine N-methyltransferase [Trifolium repens]
MIKQEVGAHFISSVLTLLSFNFWGAAALIAFLVSAVFHETTVTSSQQQWLDPSFQLNVPLVDVDKRMK